MKICFSISSLHCGGAERVISTLANEFTKMGHSVAVLLISSSKAESFYTLEEKVRVIPVLNDCNKKILRRVRDIKKIVKSLKPDVVISFLPHICIYMHFALKGTGIPHIVSERNDPNQYGKFKQLMLKHIFRKSAGCVFQTNDLQKFYSKVKDERCCVIPNPVFLLPNDDDITHAEKKNVFITVGRLEKQKGFSFLINTFEKFHHNHNDFKLKIFGNGSLEQSLKKQILDLNAQDFISILPSNNRWHYEAIESAGFISTSLFEGMPNCLEEALCLGCNCIATDCPVGGSKYLIETLKSGQLIPMNDEEHLLAALEKVALSNRKTNRINFDMLKSHNIAQKWITFIEKNI